jgi:hypothetical protein
MKKLVVPALIAAQLLAAAQPAFAADLTDSAYRTSETGMFTGLRLRVPLGGEAGRQPLRAGLAVAPTVQSRAMNGGEVRTRFGEGLEFGVNGRRSMTVSIAGTPVSRLVQGPNAPEGEKAGVSTLGWVAIGVGALVAVVLIAGAICFSDDDCIPSE